MTKTNLKRILSLLLLTVLIAAMALTSVGCNDTNTTSTEAPIASTALNEVTELGEGAKSFSFTVTDFDGKETAFMIHTDKETVGEALLELNLIAGDESAYGLYVKTVNGITADYDKDGKYWAFYVDGQYASSGVDTTNIEEGKAYAFKVE